LAGAPVIQGEPPAHARFSRGDAEQVFHAGAAARRRPRGRAAYGKHRAASTDPKAAFTRTASHWKTTPQEGTRRRGHVRHLKHQLSSISHTTAFGKTDEAHRASGRIGKPWAVVHDNTRIPALRRLYMEVLVGYGGDKRGWARWRTGAARCASAPVPDDVSAPSPAQEPWPSASQCSESSSQPSDNRLRRTSQNALLRPIAYVRRGGPDR
jgi:hypothetical protein